MGLLNPTTRELIDRGLQNGLAARVQSIFINLAQAGEPDREQRFRTGLENSITAYERAKELVEDMFSND